MANSFGSLWIGASGLRTASNALNTTSNNLSNVNTKGYVREQVVFSDKNYRWVGDASVSNQYAGLGVDIGDIVHARDVFLDKAYRSQSGRQSFYQASFDAVEEVETYLQETDGEQFKDAIADLREAFEEYAKDPSDTVNQNLVLQKAGLFLSRTSGVYEGLQDYQQIINTKIKDDVTRINDIGKELIQLNHDIQRIESSNIETAMNLRDRRDLLLDELASLARIEYEELPNSVVKVQVEGVEFLDEINAYEIGLKTDLRTGFVLPYWPQLSETENDEYYPVFNLDNVSAEQGSDIGEIKALLMARGTGVSDYWDIINLDSFNYERGLSNSIMMNSEAELDKLFHQMVTSINNLLSPLESFEKVYGTDGEYVNADGLTVQIGPETKVLDIKNCSVGSDEDIKSRELFTRIGCERYTEVQITYKDENGNPQTGKAYLYNEEDPDDASKCYTIKSTVINEDMMVQQSLIPYKNQDGKINYKLGSDLSKVWEEQSFYLNPSDKTPCGFQDFYTKWIGEIGTVGSIYESTAKGLDNTVDSIDANRQQVIGVSSDEELTNLIKYQGAYNAASRYVNVINEMIELLLTSL